MVGSPAPDFSLVDQNGETRTLSSYRSRWVVLYFYPRDDTPGCTTEACHFRDDYAAVQRLGAEILGVSIDNRDSHAAFSKNTACNSRCWPIPMVVWPSNTARSGAYGRSNSRAAIPSSLARRGASPRFTAKSIPRPTAAKSSLT